MEFIEILEDELNLKAIKIFDELQPGDVVDTEAKTSKLENYIALNHKHPLNMEFLDL